MRLRASIDSDDNATVMQMVIYTASELPNERERERERGGIMNNFAVTVNVWW